MAPGAAGERGEPQAEGWLGYGGEDGSTLRISLRESSPAGRQRQGETLGNESQNSHRVLEKAGGVALRIHTGSRVLEPRNFF
jgi:hypothetical protein